MYNSHLELYVVNENIVSYLMLEDLLSTRFIIKFSLV